jgi:short-subunit dehydrogenase
MDLLSFDVLKHYSVIIMILPLATAASVAKTCCCAAGTAAALGLFAVMDCSPSLYLSEQWHRRSGGGAPQLPPPLHTRSYWIIGASGGIGQELALQLAVYQEARELILSSRDGDQLEAIRTEIATLNPACVVTILPMDVCENTSIDAAFAVLKKQRRASTTIDTVVLNAGAGSLGLIEDDTVANVERMMRVNAVWPMIVIPQMLRGENKDLFAYPLHLVVTASVASVMPVPLSASYAAAKHALLGYIRTLRAEQPLSTRIHTFLPGPIATNFHKAANNKKNGGDNSSTSIMKQDKARCVALMRHGLTWSRSQEFYIARQPLLSLLYLNQLFPAFCMSAVYQRVGPKRRQIWQQGLDLYDPQSWR